MAQLQAGRQRDNTSVRDRTILVTENNFCHFRCPTSTILIAPGPKAGILACLNPLLSIAQLQVILPGLHPYIFRVETLKSLLSAYVSVPLIKGLLAPMPTLLKEMRRMLVTYLLQGVIHGYCTSTTAVLCVQERRVRQNHTSLSPQFCLSRTQNMRHTS